MSSKDNPCRNCEERCAGCHGRCEAYLDWQAEHKRQNEKYKAYKLADYIANGYANHTHARLSKARKSK